MPSNPIKPDLTLVQRLLIRIDPLFFSYTNTEQNKLRQTYCYEHSNLITAFLFEHVFNLDFEPEIDNEERLNSRQIDLFNAYRTALKGIGENSFVFNEFQPKDFDLQSYTTLIEYDEHEFHYQQSARKKHSKGDFIEKPYRLYLNGNWTRFLDKQGHFYYSSQYSLSNYLIQKLTAHAYKRVDELIPHEYLKGPENGKQTEGGFIWDFKVDAKGLELHLDELNERYRKYLNTLQESLDDVFHEDNECAVYFDSPEREDGEPNWNVIVKNSLTAHKIRFLSYLSDCERLLKPMSEFDSLLKHYQEELDTFLEENHQDVMANFDPKIRKLKRKNRIILSQGAVEDLSRLSDENDDS